MRNTFRHDGAFRVLPSLPLAKPGSTEIIIIWRDTPCQDKACLRGGPLIVRVALESPLPFPCDDTSLTHGYWERTILRLTKVVDANPHLGMRTKERRALRTTVGDTRPSRVTGYSSSTLWIMQGYARRLVDRNGRTLIL